LCKPPNPVKAIKRLQHQISSAVARLLNMCMVEDVKQLFVNRNISQAYRHSRESMHHQLVEWNIYGRFTLNLSDSDGHVDELLGYNFGNSANIFPCPKRLLIGLALGYPTSQKSL
jgi:hypothetical protein